MNWNASFSILQSPGVLGYIGKGILFTLVISVLSVVVSIFLGSVLALCRNYCKGKSGIFRAVSTVYIEIFRNTPLLLWIFICLVACPCPRLFARKMWGLTSVEMKILFRGVVALVLFESSIIAEIIRGGPERHPQGPVRGGPYPGVFHGSDNGVYHSAPGLPGGGADPSGPGDLHHQGFQLSGKSCLH